MATLPPKVKTMVVTLPSYPPTLRQHDALVHTESPLHAHFKGGSGPPPQDLMPDGLRSKANIVIIGNE